MADTVITLARRREETKQLSRTLRMARQDYEKQMRESRRIDPEHFDNIIENGYLFEENTADITSQMLLNLRLDLRRQFPDLEETSMDLLCAAYQCHIMSRALHTYIDRSADHFEAKHPEYGIERRRLMPKTLLALDLLIGEYIGDKSASASFSRLKDKYINIYATQIGLIKLNKTQ